MRRYPLVHAGPDQGRDLTTDLHVRRIYRCQPRVFRLQAKTVGFTIETLHSHAIVQESHDNIAIVGALLRADQHVVTIENASADHTVSLDAQSERVSPLDQGGVDV